MIASDEAVYVVAGECGQYSDHDEWIVCAYTDEEQAKKHADLARQQARADRDRYTETWDAVEGMEIPVCEFDGDSGLLFKSPWDPDPHGAKDWDEANRYHRRITAYWADGIAYNVWTTPLLSAVPGSDDRGRREENVRIPTAAEVHAQPALAHRRRTMLEAAQEMPDEP